VIEFCLSGYDKLSNKEITSAQINSTHIYEKLNIDLSEKEFKMLCNFKSRPVVDFLQELGIEKQLQDILLYAIGCFNANQQDKELNLETIDTFSFFERIQRYLRSIGYYGDSPMLTCVYGSSEYAQAFSRVGSLYGNTYIVNEEVKLAACNFTKVESENNEKDEDSKTAEGANLTAFESIEFNYNNTPVIAKKGIIVGADYQEWMLEQSGL